MFASLVAIFPGFLDGQFLNNADLPANVSRVKYETISLVAIGVTMIAGFIFYWLGAPTRAAIGGHPTRGERGHGGSPRRRANSGTRVVDTPPRPTRPGRRYAVT